MEFTEGNIAYALLSKNSVLGPRGAEDLLLRMSSTQYDELSDALLGVVERIPLELVEETHVPVANLDDSLTSVLRRRHKDGDTRYMVFINVKKSTTALILPLLGLAVATITLNPLASGLSILAVAERAWSKLTKLERPQDSNAIDVFEFICAASTSEKGTEIDDGYVTTSFLSSSLLSIGFAELTHALERLTQLLILDPRWGAEREDYLQMSNAWRCAW